MLCCGAAYMVARRVGVSHEEISCTRRELARARALTAFECQKREQAPALHRRVATLHLECCAVPPLSDGVQFTNSNRWKG
jgi:hypothetical protein